MYIKNIIKQNLSEFNRLCNSHNVKSLYAFGSSTNDAFDEQKSDIDLLIEINNKNPIERGESLMNIWDKFEMFFNKKVDLLTYSSIKNPILRNNINRTKVLIYGGDSIL